MKLFHKLRALFRKQALDREMSEELRYHLETQTEKNRAAGMEPDEARYAAYRKFGGVEQVKEAARDQRGITWLEEVIGDFRYGARQLRKAPGFATVAILTLALGIGATAAIFSIVNRVILQPLDFPDSGQLYLLQETQLSTGKTVPVAPATMLEWRKQASSFASVAGFVGWNFNLTGLGDPYRLYTRLVTPNLFPTLGVQPILGRTFRADEAEAGKSNVLILNHAFWKNHFGGREDILGQTVRLEDQPFTIIGVMPASYEADTGNAAAYAPLANIHVHPDNFGDHWLQQVVGRLKPGVSPERAAAELSLISERLAQTHPDTNRDTGAKMTPLLETRIGQAKPLLLVLLAAVGFLLLIACVNVANLLLARASSRQKEISLRVALGASRARVIRQLLAESLLLAFLGGLLGALLAAASMPVLLSFAPPDLPRLGEIHIDGRALAFSTLVTLLTGLGFGLVPALQSTRIDLTGALKDSGRGAGESRPRQRLRNVLVVAEVALALILLVGAGLLARSFSHIQHEYLGYNPDVVYVSRIQLSSQKYSTDVARVAFTDRVHEQMVGKPGIRFHAFTSAFPHHQNPSMAIAVEGAPESDPAKQPRAAYAAVTPDYFQVMSNPLLAGRWFTERDVATAPLVALISKRFADLLFPGQNPLGKRIAGGDLVNPRWAEIVGVVTDLKSEGPTGNSLPQVYVPFAQLPIPQFMCVERVVEGTPNPTAIVTAAIHAVDPTIPVPPKLVCIAEYVANSVSFQRFALFLFGIFSGVALLLAAIGIYGVMAYSVNQRTNEIGIRMALGAQREDVLRLILGQAGRVVALGLVLGLAGAFALSRLLGSLLFQIEPYDPITLVGVAALLALIAFLACWLPAQRAAKVDPLVALRHE
ncbi:MAG: ABC transporter permease [Opitutaceae bacterium]